MTFLKDLTLSLIIFIIHSILIFHNYNAIQLVLTPSLVLTVGYNQLPEYYLYYILGYFVLVHIIGLKMRARSVNPFYNIIASLLIFYALHYGLPFVLGFFDLFKYETEYSYYTSMVLSLFMIFSGKSEISCPNCGCKEMTYLKEYKHELTEGVYQHTNKDGSPDKRRKDNPLISNYISFIKCSNTKKDGSDCDSNIKVLREANANPSISDKPISIEIIN